MKESSMPEKGRFSEKEIEEAKEGFEKMARRLEELWRKEKLTPEEDEEVELILNNAAHVQEMLNGKKPEEIRENK